MRKGKIGAHSSRPGSVRLGATRCNVVTTIDVALPLRLPRPRPKINIGAATAGDATDVVPPSIFHPLPASVFRFLRIPKLSPRFPQLYTRHLLSSLILPSSFISRSFVLRASREIIHRGLCRHMKPHSAPDDAILWQNIFKRYSSAAFSFESVTCFSFGATCSVCSLFVAVSVDICLVVNSSNCTRLRQIRLEAKIRSKKSNRSICYLFAIIRMCSNIYLHMYSYWKYRSAIFYIVHR